MDVLGERVLVLELVRHAEVSQSRAKEHGEQRKADQGQCFTQQRETGYLPSLVVASEV